MLSSQDRMEATPVTNRIKPAFRDLDRHEIEQMLASHHVGRLAFTFRDRVDIEPIHYVYDGEWIFGRTSYGTKLVVLAHHPWVAFEIDEVRGPYDWRSVVAKGTVYFVEPDAAGNAAEVYERAVSAIRRVVPTAFTDDDPTPARTVLFRIHIDELQGRAAESRL